MRTDAHVHLDLMKENPSHIKINPISTKDVSLYVKVNDIDAIIGIYSDENQFKKIKLPSCKIYGFFWVHKLNLLPTMIPHGLKFES